MTNDPLEELVKAARKAVWAGSLAQTQEALGHIEGALGTRDWAAYRLVKKDALRRLDACLKEGWYVRARIEMDEILAADRTNPGGKLTGYAGVCKECGAPHIWYGEQPKKCVTCGGVIDLHGIVVKEEEGSDGS